MRREDPPSIPQLALPVSVPIKCHRMGKASGDPYLEAAGDLCLIAFFYLLRVGEYTLPCKGKQRGKWVQAMRTVQFHL
eukprot:7899975-Ditylum_brightwellii.AAC.1